MRTLLFAAALAFSSFTAFAAEPHNLISNPSLEAPAAKDGLPDGWNGWFFQPTAGYRLQIVDEVQHRQQSLLLEGRAVRRDPREPPASRPQAALPRQAWIKIEGKGNVAADVKFHYYRGGRQLYRSPTVHLTPCLHRAGTN